MTNDKRILALKAKIEEKRAAIPKFDPVTNCSFEWRGTRYNIRALDKKRATALLVELNALRLSADDAGVTYEIAGYSVRDWVLDLKGRLSILQAKDHNTELKAMEIQLSALLSDDKQTELKLDAIAALLE